MPTRPRLLACLLALLLAACATPPGIIGSAPPAAPEAASGYQEKTLVRARDFMVATANPLATEAGYQVLDAGGSAVDAAIAVQMVLTLVEPQSSGIGGGAFLLHFDGQAVQAFDGRETAPLAATPALFQGADGKPLGFYDGVIGGRSVGVPGVLRMLELAHRQHGKLPWATLFAPAIALADNGFAVSPRLHALIAADKHLAKDPVAAAYFYTPAGAPLPVGHLLKNPELAALLRAIATHGADALYTGEIAAAIVAKVQAHPGNPGRLTAGDLAAYRAVVRPPVCSDYRRWRVCGMPPPSSGGIAIAQMLGMLETRDLAALPPVAGVPRAEAVHLIAEAGRLAFADRNRYVADTDFVPLPGGSPAALLDKTYLARRAALIGERSLGQAEAGQPPAKLAAGGVDRSPEFPATSHLAVIDATGRAVSMTTTIEDAFGARQMVRGFLLNNELTDFSFADRDADGPVANRVEAGKRPRSSMAPTLVFDRDSGELRLAIGAPGGSAIINYVAKALIGILDWGLDVQAAISLPNFGSRNGPTELEAGRFPAATRAALEAQGHALREMAQTSGLQGIARRPAGSGWRLEGGADPRREGVARGR